MHNQCLNIDVQVETCMTMNLLEERERSMTVDIISRSISVGPGRDRTCDPWIRSQTSICTLVCYRLPYTLVDIYRTYTVFMPISIHFVWS